MKTTEMILVSMFAALMAIFAQITIPLPISPVPITMQELAVCLAAAILGSRLALLSQLIYIAVGIIGMPVFSGGTAGLARLMGPTGGYITGFLLASYVIGKIVEQRPLPTIRRTFLAMLCGLLLIYTCGMLQLSLVTGITLKAAFLSGVIPFIGIAIIKIVLGATVAASVRTILIKQNLLKVSG
ncbi:MAG: biotin transporter BioY [Bacillota bacterium]|nr:biotin transporter BioY [Bacillota bacterium]MDD3851009.1 biotin transporter BioY [Bacillota bacterium]MDD4707151.1 biotin transporter BioY [Bacillota bacterium]